ncbi:hypothetical protein [Bradyrhizobium sp. Gha]|uniref:hypothetical protein n=1 Tax=Bradyrhizobium sp. Gha TaxID=1855318 RepID=UPI0008E825C8|nr:hypothetical protein [Bradyrhizobium sp. Gha]SFH95196.1 hypothetical protein SAMN05216525_10352 [Bradyrhizobium sp. Gha]
MNLLLDTNVLSEAQRPARWGGIGFSVMDGLFAAAALANTLTLVTRTVKDFAAFGIPLLNPWDGP